MIPVIPKSKIYYRRKALEGDYKARDVFRPNRNSRSRNYPGTSYEVLFHHGDRVRHTPTGQIGVIEAGYPNDMIGVVLQGGDSDFWPRSEIEHHLERDSTGEDRKALKSIHVERDIDSEGRGPKKAKLPGPYRVVNINDRTGRVAVNRGGLDGIDEAQEEALDQHRMDSEEGGNSSINIRLPRPGEQRYKSLKKPKVKKSGSAFQTEDGGRAILAGEIPAEACDDNLFTRFDRELVTRSEGRVFPNWNSMERNLNPKKKAKKKYGCLMAVIPEEFAEEISRWSNSKIKTSHLGPEGIEHNPHVTLKYGLTRPLDDSMRALLTRHGPINITLQDKLSTFKDSGDGEVLKIGINSHDLNSLNKIISENYPHEDTYPDYKPHLTLAYLNPPDSGYYAGEKPGFLKRNLTIKEVKYSGPNGEEEIIPLSHHFSGEGSFRGLSKKKAIEISRDRDSRGPGKAKLPYRHRVATTLEEGHPPSPFRGGVTEPGQVVHTTAHQNAADASYVGELLHRHNQTYPHDLIYVLDDEDVVDEKAMSWLAEGSGGSIVEPAEFRGVVPLRRSKQVRPSPFRRTKSLPFEDSESPTRPRPEQEPSKQSSPRPEPPKPVEKSKAPSIQRASPRPVEEPSEPPEESEPSRGPGSLKEHAEAISEPSPIEVDNWNSVHPHQQNANTRRQKEQEESHKEHQEGHPEEDHKELEAGHKEIEVSREKLTTLRVTAVAPLGGGINESHIVDFDDGSSGVFKPSYGESAGVTRMSPESRRPKRVTPRVGVKPGTYYQREAGYSVMANYMGGGHLVPQTVVREVNGSLGSVQKFAEDAETAASFRGEDKYGKREDMALAACLDYGACHLDRWNKNWMKGPNGELIIIDGGLSMPRKYFPQDFQAVDFWAYGIKNNLEISKHLIRHRRYVDPVLKHLKKLGIEDAAIALTHQRLSALTSGKYGLVASLPSLFDPRASLRTMMGTIDATLARPEQSAQFATRPYKQRPRKA